MTRELLRWILSLNLSYPIKNARRDFLNGYLLAEILQRYYPHEVALHSFDNGATSEKRKSDNWRQLEKVCKKKGLKLSPKDIEGVIGCKEDSLIPLLERVHKKVTTATSEKRDGGPPASSSRAQGGRRENRGPPRAGESPTRYASKAASRADPPSFVPAMDPISQPQRAVAQIHHHFERPHLENGMPYAPNPFPVAPMHDYGPLNGAGPAPVGRSDPRGGYSAHESPGGYSSSAASVHHQQQQYWDPFDFGKYSYEGGAPIVASVTADRSPVSYSGDYHGNGSARPSPYSHSQQDHGYGYGAREDDPYLPSSPQPTIASREVMQSPASRDVMMPAPGSYSLAMGKENAESPKFARMPPPPAVFRGPQHPPSIGSPALSYSQPKQEDHNVSPKFAAPKQAHAKPQQRQTKPQATGIKAGSKYWELGKLGADSERKEIVEKRTARDRMKEFSTEIRRHNARATKRRSPKEDKSASTMDASKAYSARQRALDFAKNIPKPAALQRASTSPNKGERGGSTNYDNLSELDRLMVQHEADSQQINSMRHQLERQLKLASI